ncbi:BatD family protein [Celerinatantimonas yamalensis]|uniref:BatD family protein n=1 Tax=Celerinatantimonas yamalensis TaxID=559956 RepID=A0ABW9G3M4_9GAMM
MIRFIFFALLFVSAAVQAATAHVIATVSQNPVYVGRAFTLTVTADASISASEFDSSSLLRQHFVVGQTSTSRQMSDVNGTTKRQTQWVTTLLVQQPGDYQIPAFSIAGNSTQPITIHAIAYHGQNPVQQQVKIETQINHSSAWVDQSLLYTAKILVATSLSNADFNAPTAKGAKISQVGQDQQQVEVIDGRRYRTLTRHWLITPQHAGHLTVHGPRLTGDAGVIDPTFGLSEQPVAVQGKAIDITVQPQPTGFTQPWLSAERLTIEDDISPEHGPYQSGQALTRTITITAQGANTAQLPQLNFTYPKHVRVYPEKPSDHLFIKDGKIYAQRVYSIALIPTQAGKVVIPGQTITWWDTHDAKQQRSTITPLTLTVQSSSQVAGNSQINDHPTVSSNSDAGNTKGSGSIVWPTLWGMTLLLWFIREGWIYREKRREQRDVDTLQPQPQGDNWQAFANAAKAHQPKPAEHYLRRYLQQQSSEQQARFKPLLAELAALAWQPQNDEEPWDGQTFLARALALSRAKSSTSKRDFIEPLNP